MPTTHVDFFDYDVGTLIVKEGPWVDVRAYGALGDGVTDDTAAIQAVAAATPRGVIIPSGNYKITGAIVWTSPVTIYGAGTLKPEFTAGGFTMFSFNTDDVVVDGITIDGSSGTATLSGNSYVIKGGDGVTKYYNHTYKNMKFVNLSQSDGLTALNNLLVTHCIYVDNVDNVHIRNNKFDTTSGSGVFIRDVAGLWVRGNELIDLQWYPIHLEGGASDFHINANRIVSAIATGVFWGGGIDLMSQHIPLEARNKNGEIVGNYLTGIFSYGTSLRVLSVDNVFIGWNVIDEVTSGTWASSDDTTGIRVETRGTAVGSENGPVQNVTIIGNTLIAGGLGTTDGHRGIYVSNGYQSTTDLANGIRINFNKILSPNTSNAWGEGIILHGGSGGINDVEIFGNTIETLTVTSPVVGGAIGMLAADSGGKVKNVRIGGNSMIDRGTPASTFQVGIWIGAYADEIINESTNHINNYYYGIRTSTNSGPTIANLDDQLMIGCTLRSSLQVPLTNVYGQDFSATVASAASLTLPLGSDVVTVTGTTSITSIDATYNKGRTVTLIFPGILTVTDGSNLILAGSADFVTSANDTIMLVCDGTYWYEVARSAN